MKWIGQHIWDFISRFRSHVYLEGTEAGTIASGGNLGLDANNKVVKATTVSSATLASTVTVTDSNTNTSFPIVFHDESNALLDDTSVLLYNPNTSFLQIVSSSAVGGISLDAIGDNAVDLHLNFYNSKGGAAGDDSDSVGTINFYGRNDAGTPELIMYGGLYAVIGDASDSDEAGIIQLKVATEGTLRQALTATGDGASSKVDIGLGYGTSSVTTIAGTLTMGSTAAMTNAGLVSVAGQTNITSLGTLTNLDVDYVNLNDKTLSITGDTNDKFSINTGAAGVTTINTTDDSGSDGHLTISPDGGINLSPFTNKITKTYDFFATTFEGTYQAGTGEGTIIKFDRNGDTSLTAGQVYYLRPSAGQWLQADADQDTTSFTILGVGLGGGSRTVGVLLKGFISVPSAEIEGVPAGSDGSLNIPGLPVYLSTTAGHFTFTAPSDPGDIVRILGYAIDDDSGNILIYFNPDNTYIERV